MSVLKLVISHILEIWSNNFKIFLYLKSVSLRWVSLEAETGIGILVQVISLEECLKEREERRREHQARTWAQLETSFSRCTEKVWRTNHTTAFGAPWGQEAGLCKLPPFLTVTGQGQFSRGGSCKFTSHTQSSCGEQAPVTEGDLGRVPTASATALYSMLCHSISSSFLQMGLDMLTVSAFDHFYTSCVKWDSRESGNVEK